jgi:dynein heavy chain
MWQSELALKNVELAAASQEAEKLLREISESTTIAEKEKAKVAVILDQVSATAAVRSFRRLGV